MANQQKILHKDMRPIEGSVKFKNGTKNISEVDHGFEYCHQVDLGMIADLNGDGSMEIIIYNSLWEMGHALVYSQNTSGDYETVMLSDWGM